ncbi:MAG: hypothetical protein QM570_20315, partial [Planctomycetota bacterium]|nr:hypothetical protein [Planctomycetota bacterium]
VFPQPHVIIRTLFDYVIGGLQKMLLERGLSPLTISREFQIVSRRVRAEGTDTPQSLDVEATESAGKHDARVALQPEDIPAASLQLTDNAFRRCGERAFLVRFQGCQPRVIGRKKGDLPGLDEIHVLLQHEAKHHAEPHRVMCSMTSHEVRQAEVGDYSGGDNGESPEKRIDEKGFAAIQKERRRLQAILDDDGADPAERAEAQQELASLDEASKRDTRPGRKGAKSKMLRAPKSDSIRKNIDRAITVIEEQDPALAAHFKAFIKHTPEGHSYAPDVHIDWDLG